MRKDLYVTLGVELVIFYDRNRSDGISKSACNFFFEDLKY